MEFPEELYEDEPGEFGSSSLSLSLSLQLQQPMKGQSLVEPEVIAFRGWGVDHRGSMSSFELEDFVGNGALVDQIDSLSADGWGDVPALKVMCKDDMDVLGLNRRQRNALELRTYLFDRNLMNYADTLEASGQTLTELLSTSPTQLTSQFRMRRGHVARFLDFGSACPDLVHHGGLGDFTESSPLIPAPRPVMDNPLSFDRFYAQDEFKAPVLVSGPYGAQSPSVQSRGMFAAPASEPRLCGFVRSKATNEEVTPLSILEKITIRKLTPENRKSNLPLKRSLSRAPSASKVSDLWADMPTLILCLRRPGCVMCRAEAYQVYSRKSIFDAMGIQLVLCLNDHIESELKAFWPRYWGGLVVVDERKDFFKALGHGKGRRENYLAGFFLNQVSLANFKRASSSELARNADGQGTIKGGLYIIRAGTGGVAYQFVERSFGDWAPLDEVLQACAEVSQQPWQIR